MKYIYNYKSYGKKFCKCDLCVHYKLDHIQRKIAWKKAAKYLKAVDYNNEKYRY